MGLLLKVTVEKDFKREGVFVLEFPNKNQIKVYSDEDFYSVLHNHFILEDD